MTQLRPCPSCSRHVRASEQTCPFCDAAVEAGPEERKPRRVVTGRLTRAAVFAGALAGSTAVAACGTTSPAPDSPDQTNQQQTAPADASVATADTPDGDGDTATQTEPDAAVPVVLDRPPIPMPYGAPPARDRLV